MYTHLTKETRIMFSGLLKAGLSLRATARILGFHHATLSRELKRNPPVRTDWSRYHPGDAERRAKARRAAANQRVRRILPCTRLETLIVEKMTVLQWGPEQIAGWLNTYRQRLYVCTQTIYNWIYRHARHVLAHLHCRKDKYRHTRENRIRKAFRDKQKEARSIDARPVHIANRKTYGHWEGDSVVGKSQSGVIATFVERRSGYLMARILPDKTARSFEAAAKQCFAAIPFQYRKTLTLDNGVEMSNYEEMERTNGFSIYFAHPYHSWERGTNENTNGLLRYFFPKQMSFAHLTQKDIDQAVQLLNTRPRKRLGYRSPAQMFKV